MRNLERNTEKILSEENKQKKKEKMKKHLEKYKKTKSNNVLKINLKNKTKSGESKKNQIYQI